MYEKYEQKTNENLVHKYLHENNWRNVGALFCNMYEKTNDNLVHENLHKKLTKI